MKRIVFGFLMIFCALMFYNTEVAPKRHELEQVLSLLGSVAMQTPGFQEKYAMVRTATLLSWMVGGCGAALVLWGIYSHRPSPAGVPPSSRPPPEASAPVDDYQRTHSHTQVARRTDGVRRQ